MTAGKLRISFDLDGTLFVPDCANRDCDGPTWPGGGGKFHLRRGTIELIDELVARGWKIWIYTNSYRGHLPLLRWYHEIGIKVAGVVNQVRHEEECRRMGLLPYQLSRKAPHLFGFTLHVDDTLDIGEPGPQHGCDVVHVNPDDEEWVTKVLLAANRRQTREQKNYIRCWKTAK